MAGGSTSLVQLEILLQTSQAKQAIRELAQVYRQEIDSVASAGSGSSLGGGAGGSLRPESGSSRPEDDEERIRRVLAGATKGIHEVFGDNLTSEMKKGLQGKLSGLLSEELKGIGVSAQQLKQSLSRFAEDFKKNVDPTTRGSSPRVAKAQKDLEDSAVRSLTVQKEAHDRTADEVKQDRTARRKAAVGGVSPAVVRARESAESEQRAKKPAPSRPLRPELQQAADIAKAAPLQTPAPKRSTKAAAPVVEKVGFVVPVAKKGISAPSPEDVERFEDSPDGRRAIATANQGSAVATATEAGKKAPRRRGAAASGVDVPVIVAPKGLPEDQRVIRVFSQGNLVHQALYEDPQQLAQVIREHQPTGTSGGRVEVLGTKTSNIVATTSGKKNEPGWVLNKEPLIKLAKEAGLGVGQGFAQGEKAGTPEAVEAASQIGTKSAQGLRGALKESSPSKVTEEAGINFAKGFKIGVQEGTPEAIAAVEALGGAATNTLRAAVAKSIVERNIPDEALAAATRKIVPVKGNTRSERMARQLEASAPQTVSLANVGPQLSDEAKQALLIARHGAQPPPPGSASGGPSGSPPGGWPGSAWGEYASEFSPEWAHLGESGPHSGWGGRGGSSGGAWAAGGPVWKTNWGQSSAQVKADALDRAEEERVAAEVLRAPKAGPFKPAPGSTLAREQAERDRAERSLAASQARTKLYGPLPEGEERLNVAALAADRAEDEKEAIRRRRRPRPTSGPVLPPEEELAAKGRQADNAAAEKVAVEGARAPIAGPRLTPEEERRRRRQENRRNRTPLGEAAAYRTEDEKRAVETEYLGNVAKFKGTWESPKAVPPGVASLIAIIDQLSRSGEDATLRMEAFNRAVGETSKRARNPLVEQAYGQITGKRPTGFQRFYSATRGGEGGELGAFSAPTLGQFAGRHATNLLGYAVPGIVIGGLFEGLREAVTQATDLQRDIAEISAEFQALGQTNQLGGYVSSIESISSSTGVAVSEVAALALEMKGVFGSTTQATIALTSLAQGSVALNENINTLEESLTAISQAFTPLEKAGGSAFTTIQNQALHFQDVFGTPAAQTTTGAGIIGPIANSLGLSQQFTQGIVALASRQTGLSGQDVGEALLKVLPGVSQNSLQLISQLTPYGKVAEPYVNAVEKGNYGKATTSLLELIPKLSLSEQGNLIQTLGGNPQSRGVLLSLGTALTPKNVGLINSAVPSDRLSQEFQKQSATLLQAVKRFGTDIANVGVQILDSGVGSALEHTVSGLGDFVNILRELNNETDGLIGTFTEVAVGFVAVKAAIGSLGTIKNILGTLSGNSGVVFQQQVNAAGETFYTLVTRGGAVAGTEETGSGLLTKAGGALKSLGLVAGIAGAAEGINLTSQISTHPSGRSTAELYGSNIAGGAAIGTFIEPGLGTAIGAGVGALVSGGEQVFAHFTSPINQLQNAANKIATQGGSSTQIAKLQSELKALKENKTPGANSIVLPKNALQLQEIGLLKVTKIEAQQLDAAGVILPPSPPTKTPLTKAQEQQNRAITNAGGLATGGGSLTQGQAWLIQAQAGLPQFPAPLSSGRGAVLASQVPTIASIQEWISKNVLGLKGPAAERAPKQLSNPQIAGLTKEYGPQVTVLLSKIEEDLSHGKLNINDENNIKVAIQNQEANTVSGHQLRYPTSGIISTGSGLYPNATTPLGKAFGTGYDFAGIQTAYQAGTASFAQYRQVAQQTFNAAQQTYTASGKNGNNPNQSGPVFEAMETARSNLVSAIDTQAQQVNSLAISLVQQGSVKGAVQTLADAFTLLSQSLSQADIQQAVATIIQDAQNVRTTAANLATSISASNAALSKPITFTPAQTALILNKLTPGLGGAAVPALSSIPGLAASLAGGGTGSAYTNTTSGGGGSISVGSGPTIKQWAQSVLKGLGVSATGNNLTALETWVQREGGGFANTAVNNPLNTTETGSQFGYFTSGGLPAYASASQGVAATIATLRGNPAYAPILQALGANATPFTTLSAVQNSPWAKSRYGHTLATDTLDPNIPGTHLDSYGGGGSVRTGATTTSVYSPNNVLLAALRVASIHDSAQAGKASPYSKGQGWDAIKGLGLQSIKIDKVDTSKLTYDLAVALDEAGVQAGQTLPQSLLKGFKGGPGAQQIVTAAIAEIPSVNKKFASERTSVEQQLIAEGAYFKQTKKGPELVLPGQAVSALQYFSGTQQQLQATQAVQIAQANQSPEQIAELNLHYAKLQYQAYTTEGHGATTKDQEARTLRAQVITSQKAVYAAFNQAQQSQYGYYAQAFAPDATLAARAQAQQGQQALKLAQVQHNPAAEYQAKGQIASAVQAAFQGQVQLIQANTQAQTALSSATGQSLLAAQQQLVGDTEAYNEQIAEATAGYNQNKAAFQKEGVSLQQFIQAQSGVRQAAAQLTTDSAGVVQAAQAATQATTSLAQASDWGNALKAAQAGAKGAKTQLEEFKNGVAIAPGKVGTTAYNNLLGAVNATKPESDAYYKRLGITGEAEKKAKKSLEDQHLAAQEALKKYLEGSKAIPGKKGSTEYKTLETNVKSANQQVAQEQSQNTQARRGFLQALFGENAQQSANQAVYLAQEQIAFAKKSGNTQAYFQGLGALRTARLGQITAHVTQIQSAGAVGIAQASILNPAAQASQQLKVDSDAYTATLTGLQKYYKQNAQYFAQQGVSEKKFLATNQTLQSAAAARENDQANLIQSQIQQIQTQGGVEVSATAILGQPYLTALAQANVDHQAMNAAIDKTTTAWKALSATQKKGYGSLGAYIAQSQTVEQTSTQYNNDLAAAMQAQVSQVENVVQSQLTLGQITVQQGISSLYALIPKVKNNQQLLLQVETTIRQLQNSAGSNLSFNLPTTLSPTTLYAARLQEASLGGGGGAGNQYTFQFNVQGGNPADWENGINKAWAKVGGPPRTGKVFSALH
jgi:hypothetical protein